MLPRISLKSVPPDRLAKSTSREQWASRSAWRATYAIHQSGNRSRARHVVGADVPECDEALILLVGKAQHLTVDIVVVLPKQRRDASVWQRRLGHVPDRRLQVCVRARRGMGQRDPVLPGPQVRVVRQLCLVEHRGSRDASALEQMEGLIGVASTRPLGDLLVEEVVLGTTQLFGKKRVVDVLSVADQHTKRPELLLGATREGYPVIIAGTAVGALRDALGVAVARRTTGAAVHRVVHHRLTKRLGPALGLCHIDVLTLTGFVTMVQRGEHRHCCGCSPAGVREATNGVDELLTIRVSP